MSQMLVNAPQARSWRDIPQPVKPRAMSREGRWRLVTSLARVLGFVAAVLGVSWSAWLVVASLREDSRTMPTAVRTVPVKNVLLKTNLDGVLDAAWLRRALALPNGAGLMDLDLQALRARLLVDGQVSAASVTRIFPDTLEVRIVERAPVARVQAQFGSGEEKTLLVARDGVVFGGMGYSAERLEALPWLAGMKLTRSGGRFAPIEGMDTVARLLAAVQLDAGHLFPSWEVVSLARLRSDNEIEVRTRAGTVIVFGADGDFGLQIAKLDYQLEMLATAPVPPSKINLALGREVPVTFPAPVPAGAIGGAGARGPALAKAALPSAPLPLFTQFPNSQPRNKREL